MLGRGTFCERQVASTDQAVCEFHFLIFCFSLLSSSALSFEISSLHGFLAPYNATLFQDGFTCSELLCLKSRTGHSGPHAFLNLVREVQRRSARVTSSHDPSWSRANLLHWSQCKDLRRLQRVVASGSVADRGAALHQCLFEARLFERVAFCRQCARMFFSSGGRFSHVDCLHHAWFCSAAAQIDTDQAGVFDVYLMDGIIIQ